MRAGARVVAVLLFAACASTTRWERPGASRDRVEADARGCGMAAEASGERAMSEQQRIDECMRQKGYSVRAG
jgi:hypothetical protein